MSESDLAGMSPAEVNVIARGLYWLAATDGVEDGEVALIEEFLRETGSQWTLEQIQQTPFDPRELNAFLETSFMRHVFLKAAVALIAADGEVSHLERQALHRCARMLGLSDRQFQELAEQAQTIAKETEASSATG